VKRSRIQNGGVGKWVTWRQSLIGMTAQWPALSKNRFVGLKGVWNVVLI
jgi:hypothetical protein